jgi:hypothetical protein
MKHDKRKNETCELAKYINIGYNYSMKTSLGQIYSYFVFDSNNT